MSQKTCQNCKASFTIEPEDFAFYERIGVPPPTFCWRCRLQRRMVSRPSHTLYKDTCDLCHKDIISEYSPESSFTVYCPSCWYSDNWDPLSYGRDYDFSKPFFMQFRELMEKVPRESIRMTNSPGSRYCQQTTNCKNCYMLSGGYYSEDCMYGSPVFSRNTVDCDIVLNAESSYESMSCTNLFQTKYAFYSYDCLDSKFLFDCKGLSSCFGCVNLRTKSHCIFNRQYSKGEYQEKMKYWDIGSYAKLCEAKEKFHQFYLSLPQRFAILTNTVDVIGNDLQNTKNCRICFITKDGVENCKFLYGGGLLLKDSYDVTSGGDKSQLLYESMSIIGSENIKFSNGSIQSRQVEYSERTWNSAFMFGCINVRHKQYCILNKQYSHDEYERLFPRIKEHMRTTGEYGEYFPPWISAYPYNESWASEHFPMTKEEVDEAGFMWHERKASQYSIDVEHGSLPDHIRDTNRSLINRVISCAHGGTCAQQCTTAFRIISEEFDFYKQQNIALPRLCPNCRYFERYPERLVFQLWHRTCMKPGCPNEFETAIAPERKEIVYCQQCYNEEFL